MKANVWEFGGLEVGKDLDSEAERIEERLGEKMELFGTKMGVSAKREHLEDVLHTQPFKAQWGGHAAMGGNQSVPTADRRIEAREVRSDGR